MSAWTDPELTALFKSKTPLIDVRAPVEFAAGHLPGSINLPLMNDEERHLVGICFKEQGQAAAIELGHRLVSGDVKLSRVARWVEYLRANPKAQVMCLRGGLRSQISCQWISEAGIPRSPISGGYKRLRQFLLAQLEEAPLPELYRIGGLTGVGKTQLLETIPTMLDLEELAQHRGSAFGERGPQPSQASFENALAVGLLGAKKLVVEDESVMLGQLRIPRRLFHHMQAAPLVLLELPIEQRVANIYQDYVVLNDHAFFFERIKRIGKKLGGVRTSELLGLLERAFLAEKAPEAHARWITLLLKEYYDPAYEHSLSRQSDKIVFRGDARSVQEYIAEQKLLV